MLWRAAGLCKSLPLIHAGWWTWYKDPIYHTMGVCITTYRIRVGLYNTNCKINYLFSKISYMIYVLGHGLIAWIALLLLLSGDVEPNPGPSIINGWNIKSVNIRRNTLTELQSLVSVTVICLTETWLSAEIGDDEILPTDSSPLTAVHTSINSKHRPYLVSNSDHHNEIIAVETRLSKLPNLAQIIFLQTTKS